MHIPKWRAGFAKTGLLVVCASLAVLTPVLPAWAGLGGDLASVQADQLRMQGTRTTVATESYTVHEIQAATGTVVREYVSSGGTVFAVSWRGPWLPDMRQVLGTYFEQYGRAAQSQSSTRVGRRPLTIEQTGLIVELGGHSRSFSGRAYVPAMMPHSVRAEDIQ
jgi:hypothetical protein